MRHLLAVLVVGVAFCQSPESGSRLANRHRLPGKGLVLSLNLDSAASNWLDANTARDWSGQGHNLTRSGFTAQADGSLFNGTSDYGYVPYHAELAPTGTLTVAAVAVPNDWTIKQHIVSKTESGGWSLVLNDAAGTQTNFNVRRNGGYGAAADWFGTTLSGWRTLIGRYDGRITDVWMDGEAGSNPNDAGAGYPIQYAFNNAMAVGSDIGQTTNSQVAYFRGKILRVAAYNRNLSDAEMVRVTATLTRKAKNSGVPVATPFGFAEASVSPDVAAHQGYATDGTFHYVIHTDWIKKYDAGWNLVATNATPFAGITGDHLGDGDVYNGSLYVPSETWGGCGAVSNQKILVFNTSDLARTNAVDVSAQGHEMAGLAAVPQHTANGTVYVTSYCDGSKTWKYKLSDLTYLGSLGLSPALSQAQGIAYRDGWFYAPQDAVSPGAGTIRAFSLDGATRVVYTDSTDASHEGVDFSQSTLRWLIDAGDGQRKIHYLSPVVR